MDSEKYVNLSLNKLILQCSIPAIITSVFGAVYSMVDGLFVGRYLGGNALAAVNLVMPVIMIIEALSNMIATGSSVHIALLLGEKKREDASGVFTVSIKVILVCSCVIGAMGFLFAQPFVELIAPGAKIQVIQFGTEYLKVYALFAPLIPINYALDNYLRVCGKQNFSMAVGVVSQLANVVLDFLLIVVFRQGIASAAVAIRIFSISYLTGWIDMCFSSFFTAVDKPVHSLLVSVSGTLVFPVLFLCVLTKFLELDGVWLTPFVAACASGAFTLILVKKTKIMEMKR